MLIHLPRIEELGSHPVAAFGLHASTDTVGAHQLTDSPEAADVILFTQCHMRPDDWRLTRIRAHPLVAAHPEKVLVYNELDRPWCALPGIYVNMPQPAFAGRYQRPWGYFVPAPELTVQDPDLLFSFIGTDTARCRRPLFGLRHPDAVVEQPRDFRFWDTAAATFEQRRAHFRATLARSRFVLCPRGAGTSSIRLYETLAAGAVPVIIADDWMAPAGPAWEQFSIRWPEGRTEGLIELLEHRSADWPAMSRAARRAYDEYFSAGVYFHRVAELCADLLRTGATTGFPTRGVIDRRFATLAAEHAWMHARYAAWKARRRVAPAG